MALLLWYCIKGSPFLRAMLSVLRDNPLDDGLDADVFIHEPNSCKWHVPPGTILEGE